MKRILTITLFSVVAFGLSGCTKVIEKNDNTDDVTTERYNIPAENYVNLQVLDYASYLNISNPVITITVKDMGEMKIQLFPSVAPNTVANFVTLVQSNAYDNNEFHRVMTGFMIQGGMLEESTSNIPGEMDGNPLSHSKGVISMARISGNYDSQNSQFFIVQANSTFLDEEYTSFGGMISGFNILDFIASLNDGVTEVPRDQVIIESITVELNGYVVPTVTYVD